MTTDFRIEGIPSDAANLAELRRKLEVLRRRRARFW